MNHPLGFPPPGEWWTEQKGRASTAQYREWLAATERKQKRSKFGANAGTRADLGIYLKSSLENNCLRLLLFRGFQLWREKTDPPAEGKWVRYEGKRYKFTLKPGTDNERTLNYLPDFHLWQDGAQSIWEAKGHLDARSKRHLRLMSEHYPQISVEVITAPILDGMALEAIRESRRRQGPGEIYGWE